MVISRSVALFGLLALATCDRPPLSPGQGAHAQEPTAHPAADPATVSPPEPEARRFDPSIASTPASVRAAREATSASTVLEAVSDPHARGLVLWVGGERSDDPTTSGAALSELVELGHPLSPYAALKLAELVVGAEPERALALLAQVPADLPARVRVQQVQATAFLGSERRAEALDILRAAVEAAPEQSGAATAAMPLAALLATSDETADREEALALYRRVATRAPKADVGREARALAESLLATLPEVRRTELAQIPLADRFFEAQAYAGSNHHRDAEAAYEAIANSLAADAPRRCEALLAQGNAIIRQRARARGALFMADIAGRCEGEERPWARFKAGRAYGQSGDPAAARVQYAALLQESPQHRLADDALFYTALLSEDDDQDEYARVLAQLAQDYPNGDMRGEALFRLGMSARRSGRHDDALGHFASGRGVDEDAEDIRGRAAYWHARTLGALGRDSLNAYEEIVRSWPLSYYAQQSLARVREQDEARATAMLESMTGSDEGPMTFPWRHEFDDPRMDRVVALLQVGAEEEAAEELQAMGFFGPGADQDAVWFAAALFAEAGALPRVTRLVRSRLSSFRGMMPVGPARAYWRLAYPRAFAPLIEAKAADADVPAAFVRAVAREESSFDPNAVSWAHAYGLVQVILPTAQRHGRSLGVPINRQTLQDPAINLAVGTRFMAWLKGRYSGNFALLPAAYNAGHGAVDRWLRRDGGLDLDEFIEAIPYDETRRYSRRVLQTYGIYSWLDEGVLPVLPRQLP